MISVLKRGKKRKKQKANVGWFILPRDSVWNSLLQSLLGMALSKKEKKKSETFWRLLVAKFFSAI